MPVRYGRGCQPGDCSQRSCVSIETWEINVSEVVFKTTGVKKEDEKLATGMECTGCKGEKPRPEGPSTEWSGGRSSEAESGDRGGGCRELRDGEDGCSSQWVWPRGAPGSLLHRTFSAAIGWKVKGSEFQGECGLNTLLSYFQESISTKSERVRE